MNSRLLLEVRRSLRPFLYLTVLAILGVTAFVGIFRNLTFSRPWEDYREVRAEFDDVKGIFPGGHQVRINGVRVGIVSETKLEDNRAILTLKIEEKWGKVYKNAEMRIRPVTPLQDLYVNITDRGDASAGEATKDFVIAGEQTQTPVDISRVLDTFNLDTRQQMRILLSELSTGLDDGGQKLRESFASLAPFLKVAERTTRTLAERERNVRRLVHNFGTLSDALARKDRELNTFITDGNATLGELARNDQRLAQTFDGVAELLPAMRSSFASVRGLSAELDPALRSLKPVADELESGLAGLQQFGKDARPALRALRPAVTDLDKMSRQLSPTAASLVTAFDKLSEQAPSFDRMTQQVDACADQVFRFFPNTMSVLKFEDAYGSFPRAQLTYDTDTVGSVVPGVNLRRLPICTDKLGGVGAPVERGK
ncbi:MlaD family protein [Paraconexibacter algicola]|uniref:MlaD family protein n=1 Tax=Paraconexibacter algicola TaxID=2133960 RepID=UPI001304D1C8|nr:MlaD family protein [Paraconexibacter algicola]